MLELVCNYLHQKLMTFYSRFCYLWWFSSLLSLSFRKYVCFACLCFYLALYFLRKLHFQSPCTESHGWYVSIEAESSFSFSRSYKTSGSIKKPEREIRKLVGHFTNGPWRDTISPYLSTLIKRVRYIETLTLFPQLFPQITW